MRARLLATLRRDAPLKAVSLAIAAGLFLWVHGEQEAEVAAKVRVQYDVPAGRALVGAPPGEVRVGVRGSRLRLGRFEPGDLPPLRIDTTGKSGQLRLEAKLFPLPEGLRVTYMSPPVLNVATEPLVERRLPVGVRASDGRGWIGEASPATVVAAGPESAVGALREIATRKVEPGKGAVRARLAPPPGVRVKPARVTVTFRRAAP